MYKCSFKKNARSFNMSIIEHVLGKNSKSMVCHKQAASTKGNIRRTQTDREGGRNDRDGENRQKYDKRKDSKPQ